MYPLSNRHINSYIHSIISLLKVQNRLTYAEVELHLKINLNNAHELIKALEKSDKVKIERGYLEYVPAFQFKNVDELLKILDSGIELTELTDLHEDKLKIVHDAENMGKIYILKDSEGLEVVFLNEFAVEEISKEVKKMYREIKVPSYQDVLNELATYGIKKIESEKQKHILIRKAKPKKYKRRIKITNTHVKDLDWTEKD